MSIFISPVISTSDKGGIMKFKLQLVKEVEAGDLSMVAEIALGDRGDLRLENLGLTLKEAKDVLAAIQRGMVTEQIAEFTKHSKSCPECQKSRNSKGYYRSSFRSLFGNVAVSS